MSNLGSGKGLHSQTREVVFNVYEFLNKIVNKEIDITSATKTELKQYVATATDVSWGSVYEIIKQANENEEVQLANSFKSPKKKRCRKRTVCEVSDVDAYDIKRLIYNFHKTDNQRVTIKNLLRKLKDDLNFAGGRESLRKIIKHLGFRFCATQNNRKLLQEKPEIRDLRSNYLRKIDIYRNQNRPIIYMDETYIHSGHTVSKSWADKSKDGLFSKISKGQRLIILHAGGENHGFIENGLLIFKSGTKSGDYHHEMNFENYEKWLKERLIPKLPKNSVLVIDNAPYHNVQLDPAPNSNSRKQEMLDWLILKGIACSSNMTKAQLFILIKTHKDQHKKYKIDSILEAHGHTVLRLPPYHPELNPIEMVWANVKQFVASHNVTFKLEDAQRLAEEKFKSITEADWNKICGHVKKVEEQYKENEVYMDIVTDSLIINLGSESDDSDFGLTDNSDEDFS